MKDLMNSMWCSVVQKRKDRTGFRKCFERVERQHLVFRHQIKSLRALLQNTYAAIVFTGPYEGGVWKIYVQLPDDYPYKPPLIAFTNKILHPNIDEHSGSICLNVINQSWSPMYDLVNVFEIFLPQLLLYPNASHGLNHDAIYLLMSDTQQYEQKVKEYCALYAKEEDIIGSSVGHGSGDENISENEDVSSDNEVADSVAGH